MAKTEQIELVGDAPGLGPDLVGGIATAYGGEDELLLGHLHVDGFHGAPRRLGLDELVREVAEQARGWNPRIQAETSRAPSLVSQEEHQAR